MGSAAAVAETLAREPSFERSVAAPGENRAAGPGSWTSGFWGVGYTLFWLWVLVACIRLIRRPEQWISAAR